jgi:putative phosphonate metabolism protein
MNVRYAIYAVPPVDQPLWRMASTWLGRDPLAGIEAVPDLPLWLARERWREITKDARHYGFHGTLKPPMTLAGGRTRDALDAALSQFASDFAALPPLGLQVATIGGFLALVPREPSAALKRLADLAVERFDRFRAPSTEDELTRRRQQPLSTRQEEYLARWGYPYVFDEYRFHMTLTSRLPDAERTRVAAHLSDYLAPALAQPTPLTMALFVQDHQETPFRLARRFRLGVAP